MSFSQVTASPFWFPDSVLLCALLVSRPARWWIFLLAPLPIRLFSEVAHGMPEWFLVCTWMTDSAKALLAASILHRLFKTTPIRIETVNEFSAYCLFAVLLTPATGALAGAAARQARGYDFWTTWEQWFMGNVSTHLVVTPAILYWLLGRPWRRGFPSGKRTLEGIVLSLGLILTSYMAFGSESDSVALTEPRFFAPVPLLFWAAIRFGMLGASGGIAILAIFAVNAAIHGYEPFSANAPGELAFKLQHFLLLRAAPLYLVAILIQQRERVERSLRESEERFRNLADSSPVMIWMTGPDKTCTYFNQRWLDFTGRKQAHQNGDGWIADVHPEDAPQQSSVYQAAFDTRKPFTLECRLRRQDGNYRWILAQALPRLTASGDFLGYVGSCLDITDRKQMEETNRNLAHAQRLAVVGEFTAMIAHELNQPLGAILSNAEAAEMLLDLEATPLEKVREILADIRKDDLRASEAIRRIRALMRKREMELQPLDLNQTILQVMHLASGDALRRRVQVHDELDLTLPAVRGDHVHLQHVLLNLILNAIEAMSDNPAGERHLYIRTRGTGDHVEVAVRDRGHGIALEILPRIFDSFFTTKRDGTGLGLSIARAIVQLHTGRMWAENNSGTPGTTVYFTLPLDLKASAETVRPERPGEMAENLLLRG